MILDSGVLTKTERNALAKIQSSTDARLTAIADATEYVHEMVVVLLQVQRDQIAAVLKQLSLGRCVARRLLRRCLAILDGSWVASAVVAFLV